MPILSYTVACLYCSVACGVTYRTYVGGVRRDGAIGVRAVCPCGITCMPGLMLGWLVAHVCVFVCSFPILLYPFTSRYPAHPVSVLVHPINRDSRHDIPGTTRCLWYHVYTGYWYKICGQTAIGGRDSTSQTRALGRAMPTYWIRKPEHTRARTWPFPTNAKNEKEKKHCDSRARVQYFEAVHYLSLIPRSLSRKRGSILTWQLNQSLSRRIMIETTAVQQSLEFGLNLLTCLRRGMVL